MEISKYFDMRSLAKFVQFYLKTMIILGTPILRSVQSLAVVGFSDLEIFFFLPTWSLGSQPICSLFTIKFDQPICPFNFCQEASHSSETTRLLIQTSDDLQHSLVILISSQIGQCFFYGFIQLCKNSWLFIFALLLVPFLVLSVHCHVNLLELGKIGNGNENGVFLPRSCPFFEIFCSASLHCREGSVISDPWSALLRIVWQIDSSFFGSASSRRWQLGPRSDLQRRGGGRGAWRGHVMVGIFRLTVLTVACLVGRNCRKQSTGSSVSLKIPTRST